MTELAHSTNGVVGEVPQTVTKINAATDKLAAAADNFSKMTASIQKPIDTVQTTTLPELQESLENLNEASRSLKQLVDDIHNDPKGFVINIAAKERKVSQ